MTGLSENGVSDLLGAVVLVAVISTGVSLVGLHFVSQPHPAEIPSISADIAMSGTTIQIRHNGGDSLDKSRLRILVDGADLTGLFLMDGGSSWSVWSIGHTLSYAGTVTPRSIQVIYNGPEASQVIESWGESLLSSTFTIPGTPTPTATPTPVPKPVAAFIGTPTFSPTEPVTVTFTDYSGNSPTSWAWDFGDGDTTNNTVRNPVHTYALDGSYTVVLTVTNAYGSNSLILPRYITVGQHQPVAGFSGKPISGVMPLTVTFTDESTNLPTSWYWDFGDGDITNNTNQNPVHTYANYGIYSVTLTSTNEYGVSLPYTRTNYIAVSQYPPPVAEFTATPLSGLTSQVFSFTDQSTNNPIAWEWSFGDGSTSADRNPTHQYASPGTYTVSLNATNAFGSTTMTKIDYLTVSLPPPPVADFTGSPLAGPATQLFLFTDISTNTPTSWAWTFGDGGTSTDQNPGHQYTYAGSYTVALTATNAGGSNTMTKTSYITVYPTVTSISPASSQKNKPVTITIYGTGFANTATARLTLTGQSDIPGTLVTYISPMQMSFRFSLPNTKNSGWTMVVTSGGQTSSLPNAFAIT